jgi:uncharacterized protein YuzE
MRVKYDPEADAAYIRLSDAPISRTEEASDVCILDWDSEDHLVAIELLSVFGFAGCSLYDLVRRGLASRQQVEQLLKQLRSELVTVGV